MDISRQKRAPIYEALERFKKKRVVPFDVPGHKRGRGNPELVELLGEKCVGLDVNSMKPLDNLCHPVSVIREAEDLTADAFGAEHAFLMVGGTTSAVQSMILSCCKPGEEIILPKSLPEGKGSCTSFNMVQVYADEMKRIIRGAVSPSSEKPLEGLHIVVDAGNGAAGFFASEILSALGADTSGSVYLEPDGTFPNHIPNPENPAAMDAARKATVDAGADLGVIFDCDGDRGAVVFSDGTEVNRNTLIALLSAIVAEEHPGSTVVTDSVTSDELAAFLTGKLGMKHLRYKRGYKNVIGKGIELNAAGEECFLAIETSGHGAFRENYFSDDGAYIAVKIIIKMAQLKKEGKRIESLIADLKYPAESKERRFHIAVEDFRSYGEQVLKDFREFAASKAGEGWQIVEPNYEGVRVAFRTEGLTGWVLLRMSLHDPVMPMNIESGEAGGVQRILDQLDPFFSRYGELKI